MSEKKDTNPFTSVKQIRLLPDSPFYNNVDLNIYDFGEAGGTLRWRGKITVEYSEYDIRQLKSEGIRTVEDALDYYQRKIYATVRRYLLTEFELDADAEGNGGWEQILAIIEEHIREYYQK